MRSKLLKVLALLVMVSLTATSVGAQPLAVGGSDSTVAPAAVDVPPLPQNPKQLELEPAEATLVKTGERFAADELAVYIVQFVDPSLAMYKGDIAGLAATNPAARGESKLDANSPASVAYMAYLGQQQALGIAQINLVLGRSLDVSYQYKATLNGFAAEMTAAEAATVAELPSVSYIEREIEYELHTDAGPGWMGAPGIWDWLCHWRVAWNNG